MLLRNRLPPAPLVAVIAGIISLFIIAGLLGQAKVVDHPTGGVRAQPPFAVSKQEPPAPGSDLEVQWEQARWAKYSTFATIATMLVTGFGLWFVRQTLDANRGAVTEAAKANQLSRELFVATERPWVKVRIGIGGPLVYSAGGLRVTLSFMVKNIGKSPAINVWIEPRIHTFVPDEGPRDPRAIQQKHLAEIKGRPLAPWGFMLFPGEEKRQDHTLTIDAEVIEKSRKVLSFVTPTVSGFVTYGFVFDRAPRVTSFAVVIERADMPRPASDKEKRATTAIFLDDGDMPENHLRLASSPIEEEYAD